MEKIRKIIIVCYDIVVMCFFVYVIIDMEAYQPDVFIRHIKRDATDIIVGLAPILSFLSLLFQTLNLKKRTNNNIIENDLLDISSLENPPKLIKFGPFKMFLFVSSILWAALLIGFDIIILLNPPMNYPDFSKEKHWLLTGVLLSTFTMGSLIIFDLVKVWKGEIH